MPKEQRVLAIRGSGFHGNDGKWKMETETWKEKIVLATVLHKELCFCSFLVRLLHAGQRGD